MSFDTNGFDENAYDTNSYDLAASGPHTPWPSTGRGVRGFFARVGRLLTFR